MKQSCDDYVLIRNRGLDDAAVMATLAQKIHAEQLMRDFLEEYGLPQPDHVEYGFTCIRLFYEKSKTVIVFDIDEPEETEVAAESDVA